MGLRWYGVRVNDESGLEPRPPATSEPSASSRARTRSLGAGILTGSDAAMLGIGMQMLSEVVAGVLIGLALHHFFGLSKLWIVFGGVFGVVVAMWTVIRFAIRMEKRERASKAKSAGSDKPTGGG
jgi:F0F1-type ATP synthase assembly protein I